MTTEAIQEFLRGPHVGVLSTIDHLGFPHAVGIYYSGGLDWTVEPSPIATLADLDNDGKAFEIVALAQRRSGARYRFGGGADGWTVQCSGVHRGLRESKDGG